MATTVIYDPDFGDKLVLGVVDTTRENLIAITRKFCDVYNISWLDITTVTKGLVEDFFGIHPDDVAGIVADGELLGKNISERMLIHEVVKKYEDLYKKYLLRHGVELITDFEDACLYASDEITLKEVRNV